METTTRKMYAVQGLYGVGPNTTDRVWKDWLTFDPQANFGGTLEDAQKSRANFDDIINAASPSWTVPAASRIVQRTIIEDVIEG